MILLFGADAVWLPMANANLRLTFRQIEERRPKTQTNRNANMKTKNRIELTPGVAAPRNLTARTAVAGL